MGRLKRELDKLSKSLSVLDVEMEKWGKMTKELRHVAENEVARCREITRKMAETIEEIRDEERNTGSVSQDDQRIIFDELCSQNDVGQS